MFIIKTIVIKDLIFRVIKVYKNNIYIKIALIKQNIIVLL